jgi:ABC-type transport system substrate-binding protein
MNERPDYWAKRSRISRRGALRLAAAGTLGAATLAALACGDDDGGSDGGTTGDGGTGAAESALLTKPTDRSSQATRGGTFNDYINHTSWDPNVNSFGAHNLADFVYSRLAKFAMIPYEKAPSMTMEPDFASAWEIADGGQTITFKLRGLKFDDREPTNGRVSTAQDVVFSWNRWVAGNPRAYEVANSKNPTAPITSVTAPDDKTVVFKLAFPYAPFMPLMNDNYRLIVMPQEAEGKFDPKAVARGTGAWMVDNDSWPTTITLKRNPNWYEKDRPYYDNWVINNVPEYATGSAQLRAGRLDTYTPLTQEDVLLTKKDVPAMQMVQQANFTKALGGVLYFGQRPGSPFLDDRVRKAVSMMIDRDLWLDTYSNRKRFEAEGLPVQTTWGGWVGPGYSFFLDPRKDDLGAGAKFMRFNLEEAKKLLQASGQKLPIETTFWTANNTYTPDKEAYIGMIQATGDIKATIKAVPLDELIKTTQVQFRAWDFDGFGQQNYNETADWDWTHSLMFDPLSTNFQIPKEDPKMTDFYIKQRQELDESKRATILKDFQKYAAETMYYVTAPPGQWKNFRLAQPWVGNWGYYQLWNTPNYHQESYTTYFFDSSKKT